MTQMTQAYLEVCDDQGKTRMVPLQGDTITIGRSAQAELQLDSPAISRRHASLTRDPAGRWWVRDLDSHNGIYVNGQRTRQCALTPDDCVQIDTFTLRLLSEPTTDGSQRTRDIDPHGPMTIAAGRRAERDDAAQVSMLRQVEPPHVSTPHLSLLSRFGSELINMSDDADRLVTLCRLLVGSEFHARSAMALSLRGASPEAGPTMLCPVQTSSRQPESSPYLSRTLLRVVRESGEPAMASNVRQSGAAGGAGGSVEISIAAEVKPMAAIACPIHIGEQSLDVLYATLPPEYATGEWLALVALAVKQYQQAELAWAGRRDGEALAAIERELEQARKLQVRLVPQQRDIAGLDTGIAFEPCRWVGGDYADILPLKDGRTLLAVADVCGKGMQAALTTSSVHTMVHAAVRRGASLTELMQNLNEHLVETLPDSSFVTMTALAIDVDTGEVECINAGHPPVFVVAPDGALRRMQEAANLPLGIAPEPLALTRERIDVGHWLAMYSDGLSELTDEQGRMLGIDGLGEQLRQIFIAAPDRSARDLADEVMRYVHRVQDTRLAGDDYTLLIARRW